MHIESAQFKQLFTKYSLKNEDWSQVQYYNDCEYFANNNQKIVLGPHCVRGWILC